MRHIIRACLLTGLPVSAAGFAGLTVLLTAADLPLRLYPAAASIPLLAGCFCAGFSAGKAARLHGIRCGSLAALLLAALWYAAVCITAGMLRSPMLLCVLLPAGAAGGILGVNTPLPLTKRHSHLPARLQTGTALLLRHRPGHRACIPEHSAAQSPAHPVTSRR